MIKNKAISENYTNFPHVQHTEVIDEAEYTNIRGELANIDQST